jgi:hypothetical protein
MLAWAIPAARAQDEPGGYAGKGTIVVQTSIGGPDNKISLGGTIALEERGSRLRVDVVSLGIPGMDPTISSLISTSLIPGGFTIVYDRRTSGYVVWSAAKRTYYASTAPAAGTSRTPPLQSGAAVAIGAAGDLFGAFGFARSLKDDDDFTASLSLAGHGVVNGHPATGLDYRYARTTKSGDATDIHGRLQLADDLDAIPVEITANVTSGSIPPSTLRLELTQLAKATPPNADFEVPPGFARADDLFGVLGKNLPHF